MASKIHSSTSSRPKLPNEKAQNILNKSHMKNKNKQNLKLKLYRRSVTGDWHTDWEPKHNPQLHRNKEKSFEAIRKATFYCRISISTRVRWYFRSSVENKGHRKSGAYECTFYELTKIEANSFHCIEMRLPLTILHCHLSNQPTRATRIATHIISNFHRIK